MGGNGLQRETFQLARRGEGKESGAFHGGGDGWQNGGGAKRELKTFTG